MARSCTVCLGLSGSGSQGLFRCVTVCLGALGYASRGLSCRGHVRCDKEWIGSRGVKRCVVSGLVESGYGSRGELQYVAVNRGMAGHVKAVMFRFGFALYVWVRQSC